MRITKSRMVILLFLITLIITLILISIYLLSDKRNRNTTLELPVSSTVSSPLDSTIVSTQTNSNTLSFSILRPTINPLKPFSEEEVNISISSLEHFSLREINPGSKLISNPNFSILFSGVGEGNPINNATLPEYVQVSNKLAKTIYRVDHSYDDNMKTYFSSQGIGSLFRYYYTSTFDIGCFGQMLNGFCGTNYTLIKQKENGDKINLRIYCLTSDKHYLSNCDSVISNMSITLNE